MSLWRNKMRSMTRESFPIRAHAEAMGGLLRLLRQTTTKQYNGQFAEIFSR